MNDYVEGGERLAALCRIHGVSRATAHKWLHVFEEEGYEAHGDRSRAPRSHPNATPEAVEERILVARAEHPTWGAYRSRRDAEMDYSRRKRKNVREAV